MVAENTNDFLLKATCSRSLSDPLYISLILIANVYKFDSSIRDNCGERRYFRVAGLFLVRISLENVLVHPETLSRCRGFVVMSVSDAVARCIDQRRIHLR